MLARSEAENEFQNEAGRVWLFSFYTNNRCVFVYKQEDVDGFETNTKVFYVGV